VAVRRIGRVGATEYNVNLDAGQQRRAACLGDYSDYSQMAAAGLLLPVEDVSDELHAASATGAAAANGQQCQQRLGMAGSFQP
jgi:hypothetical protein